MNQNPSYKHMPSIEDELERYSQPGSNLQERYGQVGVGQGKRGKPVLSNAASNAEIASYARAKQQDLLNQDQGHQMLSRARSKDHVGLHALQHQNSRDKYMQLAGAQRVLQGGREDKERMLQVARHRTEDVYNLGRVPQYQSVQQAYEGKKNQRRLQDNKEQIRRMNQ